VPSRARELGNYGASSGNVRTSVLAGPSTGLTSIRGVQTDDAGNIYVFDCSASHGIIRIFAPGSTGNTAPAATIKGLTPASRVSARSGPSSAVAISAIIGGRTT
jgi:hypothetical protein